MSNGKIGSFPPKLMLDVSEIHKWFWCDVKSCHELNFHVHKDKYRFEIIISTKIKRRIIQRRKKV